MHCTGTRLAMRGDKELILVKQKKNLKRLASSLSPFLLGEELDLVRDNCEGGSGQCTVGI